MLRGRGATFDPNAGIGGVTRLYLAATPPSLEMLRWLLDLGADPNDGGTRGMPPLLNAANRGHLEAVRLLLDRGADVNRPRGSDLAGRRRLRRLGSERRGDDGHRDAKVPKCRPATAFDTAGPR